MMEVAELLRIAREKGLQGSDRELLMRISNDPRLAAMLSMQEVPADSFLGLPKGPVAGNPAQPQPQPQPQPVDEPKGPRPAMLVMLGVALVLVVVLVVVIVRKKK